MGEVNNWSVELRADNPKAKELDLVIALDYLRIYCEGAQNVRKNGAIVAHPRTGAPIENPYFVIVIKAGQSLSKLRSLKLDRVLALMEASSHSE